MTIKHVGDVVIVYIGVDGIVVRHAEHVVIGHVLAIVIVEHIG